MIKEASPGISVDKQNNVTFDIDAYTNFLQHYSGQDKEGFEHTLIPD